MTTISNLNTLSKIFKKGGNNANMNNANMNNTENSNISSTNTRNTLDDLLKNIMEVSECKTHNSSSSSNTNDEGNVTSKLSEVINKQSTQQNKLALKIVNIVRYLSSPLRLYMKISFQIQDKETVNTILRELKLNDTVKNELISGWTEADTYGLYILSKVFRNKDALDILLRDQSTYLQFFDTKTPFDVNSEPFYLFRVVFGGGVKLQLIQNMVHKYFTNLLDNDDEEINQMLEMFTSDLVKDLKKKIAYELNNFAIVVSQKRIGIKNINNIEQCYTPQGLYHSIRELLMEKEPVFYGKLLEWESSDVNVEKMGGKKTLKKKNKKH